MQVLGFSDIGHLTQLQRLNRFIRRKRLSLTGQPAAVQRCAFVCSSGQHFAFGFLQISPHDEHPCRSANTSPCRVCRGLAPPSQRFDHHSQPSCATAQRAVPGARKKKPVSMTDWFYKQELSSELAVQLRICALHLHTLRGLEYGMQARRC